MSSASSNLNQANEKKSLLVSLNGASSRDEGYNTLSTITKPVSLPLASLGSTRYDNTLLSVDQRDKRQRYESAQKSYNAHQGEFTFIFLSLSLFLSFFFYFLIRTFFFVSFLFSKKKKKPRQI